MYAYHVVTERPMQVGQQIIFDEVNHNGVYQRVCDKMEIVKDIYSHPENYNAEKLEHHTSVALRELALEEVRKKKYSNYPSRMACLYVFWNVGWWEDNGCWDWERNKWEYLVEYFIEMNGDYIICTRGRIKDLTKLCDLCIIY